MFIIGYLLNALAIALSYAFDILIFLIFIRALLSWFSPDPYNPLVQILHRLTEPILEPVRRLIPPMGIDLSPLIAFFVIIFLSSSLIPILKRIAMSLIN